MGIELAGLGLVYLSALRLSGELAAGEVRRLRRLLEGIRDQGLSFFTPTYRLTMETPR